MSEEDKFIEMIKKNEGVIYKITTIYARNGEDQKDLYQEIVAQLWTAFEKFRGEAKVSTWIYRIALNTAITRLRKETKRNSISIDQAVLAYTQNSDPVWEGKIKLLYHHIGLLNDLEKGIILLFLEDKSYEEIATITGLSPSNVGTRLSRIRQKLRTRMLKKKQNKGQWT